MKRKIAMASKNQFHVKNMKSQSEISAIIRRTMVERLMTNIDLQRSTGLTQATISSVKNGAHFPSIGTLRAIASALNIPMDLFKKGAPEDTTTEHATDTDDMIYAQHFQDAFYIRVDAAVGDGSIKGVYEDAQDKMTIQVVINGENFYFAYNDELHTNLLPERCLNSAIKSYNDCVYYNYKSVGAVDVFKQLLCNPWQVAPTSMINFI